MKGIFRFAMLLTVVASLFSCDSKQDADAGLGLNMDFYITSSKDVIKSDGVDYAEIKVILDGEDVTSSATIYGADFKPVTLLDGNKFVASEDGEYKFWAEHGTYMTYNRGFEDNGLYTIKAISQEVPQPVVDEDAANVDFVHRALLTQYTGTSCGYCPYMINILKQVQADGYIPSKAVLAAAHSGYNTKDEAAINRLKSPADYPYLQVDLVNGFAHNLGKNALCNMIENSIASPAKAGISVNPAVYGDSLIVLTVSVKAAEDGIYNVGTWLLEDNIYSPQDDYDNIEGTAEYIVDGVKKVGYDDVDWYGQKVDAFDVHENCIRVVDSDYMGTYFGRLIGPMKKGQTENKTFVLKIDTKKWTKKKELEWLMQDLHLAVFVSYGEKKGSRIKYSVCNAVDCPIDAPTPFEYNN